MTELCECEDGYHGDDCSLGDTAAPEIFLLAENGLCDLQYSHCEVVSVYGQGFSAHDVCHLTQLQVGLNRQFLTLYF